jgi:hypothetical protein
MLNSATTLIQRDNQGGSPMQTMYYSRIFGLKEESRTAEYGSYVAQRTIHDEIAMQFLSNSRPTFNLGLLLVPYGFI